MKKSKKIWVNCIVYNEENFIWYALMSVIDYVDKILVYDTGSTDKTVEIIREVSKQKPNKILFKEVGKVSANEFTKIRQEMLDKIQADWLIILDGDEVWFENSIKSLVKVIDEKGDQFSAIVVPFYNLVGDIYHYQKKEKGQYSIKGRKGHITIRAINQKIEGLHVDRPFGQEGYFNNEGILIQNLNNLYFLETPYLHFTHLKRSSKKQLYNKYKYDLGIKFPSDFRFPEVFYNNRKKNGSQVWQPRSLFYELLACIKELSQRLKVV